MSRYSTAVLDALPLAGAAWLARRDGCTHPWHDKLAVLVHVAGAPEPPAAACPGCGVERPARLFRLVIVTVPDRTADE